MAIWYSYGGKSISDYERKYQYEKKKIILIASVVAVLLAIIGIIINVMYNKSIYIKNINLDDVYVEQIQKIDNGFTAMKLNIEDSNEVKGIELYCINDTMYVTLKDMGDAKTDVRMKSDNDANMYVSDKNFSKIIVKCNGEQKVIWDEGESKVNGIDNLELANNIANNYYENRWSDNMDYPKDAVNELVFSDIVVNNYRVPRYTEAVSKTTDDDFVYLYVDNQEMVAGGIEFWVEVQTKDGKYEKISDGCKAHEGSVQKIQIDEAYAKKDVVMRVGMKNSTASKHFGIVSGRVDFR